MHYADGQPARLGDHVKLGDDCGGVVVCSLDTSEYAVDFPEAQWSYLKTGILVKFLKFGVIHYETPEPGLELLSRER